MNNESSQPTINAYKRLVTRSVGSDLPKPKLEAELKALKLKDAEVTQFSEAISVRSFEIREQLIRNASSITKTHLTDFDWKLNLSLGSDKVSNLREVNLRVNFTVHNESGKPENISLELKKDELDTLIASLLQANKSLQPLRN
eukprot:TRINITY_DN1326_c0_g1_i1.p1 TRINITY_DN1326_c0_g1~~TRINITY_DN1326_c0_g1_i1.p1  ORF type:complete len:143 (-),score=23.62 TRINITY_DN1326_c0_g1_i1:41-469(-)